MAKFFIATVNKGGLWIETMFNEDAIQHIESQSQKAFLKMKDGELLECRESLDVLKGRIFPRTKTFVEKLFGLWD